MQKKKFSLVIWTIAMLFLILDSKTAISGAAKGLELCIRTVIPSLFPIFVISALLTSNLSGTTLPVLRPFGKLFRIPEGSESLLLTGFLGGYPIGAQCIYDAWHNGSLSRPDAHRILGFCNNAGPAFIFGMTSVLFQNRFVPWFLWGIQIASALITALLIPGTSDRCVNETSQNALTLPQAIERSIHSMGNVCGWIILFRVLLAVCQRWILAALPTELNMLFTGFLELANGCCEMKKLPLESIRFMVCCVCLSFGGLCVGMQTVSAVKELGTGLYFPGKIMQTMVSFLLAALCLPILFSHEGIVIPPRICMIFFAAILAMTHFLKFRKKCSGNSAPSIV